MASVAIGQAFFVLRSICIAYFLVCQMGSTLLIHQVARVKPRSMWLFIVRASRNTSFRRRFCRCLGWFFLPLVSKEVLDNSWRVVFGLLRRIGSASGRYCSLIPTSPCDYFTSAQNVRKTYSAGWNCMLSSCGYGVRFDHYPGRSRGLWELASDHIEEGKLQILLTTRSFTLNI